MWFDTWVGLGRVAVVGVCAYAALVLFLRTSGKRTLATVLLSKDVALAEGVFAFAVLIALQFVIAWLSVRSATVRRLVKSEPALLWHRGTWLPATMAAERVTADEVRAAVRAQGVGSLEDVAAVVLETDGSFSVIQQAREGTASTLTGVTRPAEVS